MSKLSIEELKEFREYTVEELKGLSPLDFFNRDVLMRYLFTLDLEISRLEREAAATK